LGWSAALRLSDRTMKVKFDAEQKAAIEDLIERRLIADRATRARDVAALVVDRDRLLIENERLRTALEQLQPRRI
jgi:hypothetical protein